MTRYTEKDIIEMMEAIEEACDFLYSPGNTKLRQSLRDARNYFENLLEEERV